MSTFAAVKFKIPADMSAEIISVRGAESMTAGYNRALKIFSEKEISAVGMIGCMNLLATGVW